MNPIEELARRNRPERPDPWAEWTREELLQEIKWLRLRVKKLEKIALEDNWRTNPGQGMM